MTDEINREGSTETLLLRVGGAIHRVMRASTPETKKSKPKKVKNNFRRRSEGTKDR